MLYARDHDPSSHGGVLSLFGSEVVATGDAPRTHGTLLDDLGALRKQADYGYGPVDADVDELVDDTHEFVEAAASLSAND